MKNRILKVFFTQKVTIREILIEKISNTKLISSKLFQQSLDIVKAFLIRLKLNPKNA